MKFHFRSAKFFSRAFFGVGPSSIQVAGNFFTFVATNRKKLFCLHVYWLIFFFKVTTYEWCPYFLNLSVLLENVIYVRLHVDGKSQKETVQDFQSQVGNRNLKDVKTQTEISFALSSPANSVSRPFWPLRNSLTSFALKLCDPVNLCDRELSFRTRETPPFR